MYKRHVQAALQHMAHQYPKRIVASYARIARDSPREIKAIYIEMHAAEVAESVRITKTFWHCGNKSANHTPYAYGYPSAAG